MKNLFLSAAALVGLTAGAMAADLPVHKAPPAPLAAVPVFTWTGFYVGVNAGFAFSDNEVGRGTLRTPNGYGSTYDVVPATGTSFNRDRDDDGGFTGGGQVGYNMQFGMFVAGIEADIQAIDLGDGRGGGIREATQVGAAPFGIGAPRPGFAGNVAFFDRRQEMDFFGTVRGRLGITFGQALIYATGGLAWTSLDDANRDIPAPGFFTSTAARTRAEAVARRARSESDDIGWTVGGGVEYAFTNSISAKIEGLYVNIGDVEGNNIVGVTNRGRAIRQTGGRDESGEFAVVRAGLNFRFGTW
jgi:outer membrane immunogenic protein